MNSRSGVNESSLVNFSSDLPSLDTKDSLLSFPFDHLYACHSESSDPRDSLELSKVVGLPVPCMVREDKELGLPVEANVNRLNDRLTASENQNKRLKDLLIYHLDLIQQQNELITRRDKLYQALLQENQTLKNKLHRRHGVNPPAPLPPSSSSILPVSPVVQPPPLANSSVVTEASQIMLNSFTELLLPENRTNSFLFDNDLSKPKSFEKETFGIARTTTPTDPDLKPFACDTASQSVLEQTKSKYSNMRCEVYKSNEKRPLIKKETEPDQLYTVSSNSALIKSSPLRSVLSALTLSVVYKSNEKRPLIKEETEPDQLHTVSSNSDNPVIQKVQRKKRTTAGVGQFSRTPKNSTKVEIELNIPGVASEEPTFDLFGINRKNKTINTYGKARNNTTCTATSTTTSVAKRSKFGSLSDRLQLIDTTPTGEDPYQLGEADLREQSPIPKLMLQKTNHGRMKVLDQPSRRIYDPASPEPKTTKRASRCLSNNVAADLKKEAKTMIIQEPDLDLVKTEPEIDWRIYPSKTIEDTQSMPVEYSLSDSCGNPASSILLDCNEFQDLFTSDSALNLEELNVATTFSTTEKLSNERPKRRGPRPKDMSPLFESSGEHEELPTLETQLPVPPKDSKRGRKRALSTTGLGKGARLAKVQPPKRPSRAKARVKKSPPPPRTTRKEYHTHVGDPDLSWYLGLDPEVKTDDIDPPTDQKSATVEVPRWREKPFTSIDTYDGAENLDDKAFEKRHQKLEAEERRQLRWHMRRIREQRHVEKLKHRQRYAWCQAAAAPSVYTVWPRPQRDARSIELSSTLPVTAFGEPIPDLPPSDFKLPWVRTSRAQKRSKRSKTLH